MRACRPSCGFDPEQSRRLSPVDPPVRLEGMSEPPDAAVVRRDQVPSRGGRSRDVDHPAGPVGLRLDLAAIEVGAPAGLIAEPVLELGRDPSGETDIGATRRPLREGPSSAQLPVVANLQAEAVSAAVQQEVDGVARLVNRNAADQCPLGLVSRGELAVRRVLGVDAEISARRRRAGTLPFCASAITSSSVATRSAMPRSTAR